MFRVSVVAGFVLGVTTLIACGSSPSPSAPSPATFALSGTVTSVGNAVVGATVSIVDGPNANRRTATTATGQYRLSALQAGSFTVRVTATDYPTADRPVTLTADTVLDVDLLRAVLDNVPDTVQGIPQPDGSYALAPAGINNGTGCAGSIAGSTDITNSAGPIKTIAWSLPPSTVVRPGERFTYQLCCLTHNEAFSAGVAYFTKFTYVTIPCP